ncbi:MAG TPA: isoprenylcysteine carboxylmethyltransferase family protein [Chloroflexota bacterium]|nr:isoprenylcysteine carboxylmethyltransferase family protein [Chloroflexota bacterium]
MFLRLLLLSGLVFHKILWEVTRQRAGQPTPASPASPGFARRTVKLLKVVSLGSLVLQTLALNVLPISNRRTPLQKVGVGMYILGLAVAVLGRLQLGANWSNLEDSQVLPRQRLVRNGIYAYLRHPIYAGDLLLLSGLELALNSWLVLGVIFPLLVVLKRAKAEESALAQAFEDYREYSRSTKRYIPFVI